MRLLSLLTTGIIILLLFIIFWLLAKIHILTKQNKYADEANMWHKLAITDSLTGLYNRNAYNLYFEKNKNNSKTDMIGIILFDVDDFKIINDTKGHKAGDEVLKTVSAILLDVFCDPRFKVFRIGGDEFSVLTESVSESEIIKHLIALKKRLDTTQNIKLSKGYSIIETSFEESFQFADEMLYADKLSKKMQNSSAGTSQILGQHLD